MVQKIRFGQQISSLCCYAIFGLSRVGPADRLVRCPVRSVFGLSGRVRFVWSVRPVCSVRSVRSVRPPVASGPSGLSVLARPCLRSSVSGPVVSFASVSVRSVASSFPARLGLRCFWPDRFESFSVSLCLLVFIYAISDACGKGWAGRAGSGFSRFERGGRCLAGRVSLHLAGRAGQRGGGAGGTW